MEVSDNINMNESIKIDAYQSVGLVRHTRRLANLVKQFSDPLDITALATATIIMAAAALESLLLETAYILNPSLYASKEFRYAGAPKKFEMLMGYASADAEEIWESRKALTHAEPDNPRSRYIGEKINIAGASWVAATIEKLAREVWGDRMPDWFAIEIKSVI
jgi:hypothetical protein